MFAEITKVDYRFCLPTKENKLPFSVFRLQKTYGSLPFQFSFCSKQMEVVIFHKFRFPYIYIETAACIYIYLFTYICL